MSSWTYVTGAICVDTYSENALNKVKEFLETAPKITGSERNADIFLNQPSGHNAGNYGFDEIGNVIDKEWDTRVIITIFGTLRDRTKYKTKKEYKEFIMALSQYDNFDIDYSSVKITT